MKAVFVGGSRNISRLNAEVRQRLDNMIENNLHVLIGDANGADKAMQRHFETMGYRNIEVFCVGGECRNNLGQWSIRAIASESRERDFAFYAAKDRIMAREASVGFMVWDGKSIGTLLNVFRLLSSSKKAVVYVSPKQEFLELRQLNDWESFITACHADVRRKVEQKAAMESHDDRKLAQARLAL
jgi:adenine-specific DNA-methyltransferase